MKKIFLITVTLILCLLFLCACTQKHYDENNISELYNREWIIGKSREEIENKYGDFDEEFISDDGENLGAFYVNYENNGLDADYIHDTYFVVFDNNDIAIDAFFIKSSIGG